MTPSAPNPAWQISTLAESARQLAAQGELDEAEKIYRLILQTAPYHVRALNFLAVRCMERGSLDESQQLLEQALRADPQRPILYQNLGLVYRARGELEPALAALERAVSLRPELATAWLHKGTVLEALERKEQAVAAYRRGCQALPDAQSLANAPSTAENLRALIRHALEAVREAELAFIAGALQPLQKRYGDEALRRVRLCAEIHAGARPAAYLHALQRPAFLYLPEIPPRPFFEREEFPWLAELEAATPAIQSELEAILAAGEGIRPYVEIEDGVDPMQWRELNRSLQWGSFQLYKAGHRIEENCARCPRTAETLGKLPLPQIPEHAPEAFFSILQPGTHIPPHFGLGNYKLAVHLPLIVPADCAIRVGHETRSWRRGECLIFDDSFQHEAWNRSATPRAVLIIETWNPLLTEAERAGVQALVPAIAAFRLRCEAAADGVAAADPPPA